MKKEIPKILPLRNGPFQVKNLQKFTNSRSESIETRLSLILCRCGGFGIRVTKNEELEEAVIKALNYNGLLLLKSCRILY